MAAEAFVHVLLFQCPRCASPITTALKSPAHNPEDVDKATLSLSCNCSWNGTSSAIAAKRHWISDWV